MNQKILRKTLAGAFALAIVASSDPLASFANLTVSDAFTANAASVETENVAIPYDTTFKKAFENYFPIGGLVNLTKMRTDYYLENYNLLSEDNALKPDCLLDLKACQASGSETEVQISLHYAEPILKFCEENGIPLFGSTFVWYSQTPEWFFRKGFSSSAEYVDKETMNKRLESFIKNTFEALSKEYPDLKIAGYEVCKEVFVNDGGGMRPANTNTWMKIYNSDEYVLNAFKYARQYAPEGTDLYYGDYNEYFPDKAQDIYDLAVKILAEGDYLDGICMEAVLGISFPYLKNYETVLTTFEDAGLDIMLSEFCVNEENDVEERLELYRDIFEICMKHHEHIKGIILDDYFSCEREPLTAPTMEELFGQQTTLKTGEAKITITDYDTGVPLPQYILDTAKYLTMTTNIRWKKEDEPGGWIYTGPVYTIDSNPFTCDLAKFLDADVFEVDLTNLPDGYYLPDDGTVFTKNENNSLKIEFRLRKLNNGDVDGDGLLGITDAVLLQKWILAPSDTTLKDWKAADFNHDNVLNVLDLTLMKQVLYQQSATTVVRPHHEIQYSSYFYPIEEIKLYLGPDERYDCVATIPADTRLAELGYNNNNDEWIYTKYNEQYGWIKNINEAGYSTIYYEAVPAKPVIYLYPEKETDVHVELELTEAELATTYPKYHDGWDVTAYPDGTLLNKADGTHHEYLFWDGANCRTRFDYSKGFCVAGCDTESFLREKLTYMGLTESEMNEFIVYWLPLMEHHAYNLIAFQGETYTDTAKLNITPTPDSLLRVFMAYVPLENAVEIEPQQLSQFERNGFTVVEWGGCQNG